MKRILRRTAWLGRGTATMMGLALMLAVVLGVATTALAAVPGDPFKLGNINAIDRLTTLAGSTNNPMLRVDNDSTGPNATALDLQVQPGKAPMKVNSATRVTNLHADRLDGQNAPLLMRVEASGDLASNDTIATVEHTPNSGYYTIEFVNNRVVAGCVYQATLIDTPGGGEISVQTESVGNRLTVITTRNNLVFTDRHDFPFHLVIYC
ncbi:MAG: hypothetical protein ACRDTR_24365 [Rubrobacter sp.]